MASTINGHHDLSTFENMLHQFRVNELQTLLATFKIPKLGKKNELFERAMRLLYNRPINTTVINKIREIHTRRFVNSSITPISSPILPTSPIRINNYPDTSINSNNRNTMSVQPNTMQYSNGTASGMIGNSLYDNYLNRQSTYHQQQSNSVVNRARHLRTVSLPFYDLLHVITDPTELVANNHKCQQNEANIHFTVHDQYVQSLCYRSDVQPLPRIELQLRFFPIDLLSEQKDDFPPNCAVRLDDNPVQLPNIIPTNKPNTEAKRPSRPVNITPYCQPTPRTSTTHPHRLTIGWTSDKRSWAISISIVRRLNSAILLKRMCDNPQTRLKADNTRRIIIRRLNGGDDCDIEMSSIRVSLLCPLGKVRMQIPVKPRNCDHLQCFDANLFLMMNEKKPTWRCPVCDQSAKYSDLIIDGYFEEVLAAMQSSGTEIELLKDGDWKPVECDATVLSSDDDNEEDATRASSSSMSKESWLSSTATTSKTGASAASRPTITRASSIVPTPSSSKYSCDDDIIVLGDSDDDEVPQPPPCNRRQPTKGAATINNNNHLRPSPSSPTQSEGGSNASSDPSIIFLDLADLSSSPLSRPDTRETNPRSTGPPSSSSYSTTPVYESMTSPTPVPPPPPPNAATTPIRRIAPTSLFDNGGGAPPAKRINSTTTSIDEIANGLPLPVPPPPPSMMMMPSCSNGQQQQQQSSYTPTIYGQSNMWSYPPTNNYTTYPSAPPPTMNGYYGTFGGVNQPRYPPSTYQPQSTSSMYHHHQQQASSLPDFTSQRVNEDLQAFLSTIGMQPTSSTFSMNR